MWYMTPDNWHLTPDTWQLSPDMWQVTCDTWWGVSIFLNVSSPALRVWDKQCLEDSELKDDSIDESVSNKGVYRTAPATPGLVNIIGMVRCCLLKR